MLIRAVRHVSSEKEETVRCGNRTPPVEAIMNIISRLVHQLLIILFEMLKSIGKTIQDGATKAIFGKEAAVTKTHFYELIDKDMKRVEVPMSNFKRHVLLVTNVASQ